MFCTCILELFYFCIVELWVLVNFKYRKKTTTTTKKKLSKAQISKIIQSGGSFGFWLGHLGKKTPTNIAISLTRDNLPGLISNLTPNAIDKFERKISGKEAVRAGKGFTLFILNETMNNVIKIIKWLEDSGLLIDGVTETVKPEIKTQ